MVDNLARDRDGAAGCGITDGDEERNLGFWVLGVLGLRVQRIAGVRRDLEECRDRWLQE
jgi:hypothetical protein